MRTVGKSLTEKILQHHRVSGSLTMGQELAIKIDHTLTQDSTGTMAYLQLEALGVDRVQTKRSVAYIDHNTLQVGYENADDHAYIQSVAAKYGIYFSRPGNGICHQVNLERFSIPGDTLLGSDSHTPTCGGMGMLAMGAGGLDVAVAMGGGAYYLTMPEIVNVRLTGSLPAWSSAKDIILELLRRLTVKGGVGKVFEYSGEGVATLSVPERATITNMGAELGATTSIFPSDHNTYAFLQAQGRADDWQELKADADAVYTQVISINLNEIEPLVACPHSPDQVVQLSALPPTAVNQVCIGSCTNSSYTDMMKVAEILKHHTVHPGVSLVISPGSKQVLTMLSETGALTDMIEAGARILECACGPCIGMGQAPATEGVSLRTFNRNFHGRSGTANAEIYLCSPEVAAISAITGYITDPRTMQLTPITVQMPDAFMIHDNLIIPPVVDGSEGAIKRGPNIKPFPQNHALPDELTGSILLKMGNNITTDDIMPSPAWLLPLRSNIPALSKHCLSPIDPDFPARAAKQGGGFLVAGENYGQGSSREHAALVPLYLGIKGVIARSFARIHVANLINSGILPLVFVRPQDYDVLQANDQLSLDHLHDQVKQGDILELTDHTQQVTIQVKIAAPTERLKEILMAGGLLSYTKNCHERRQ